MLPSKSSHIKAVYDPKAFLLHAALLRQTFVHCAKFPTAASRRSLGRVSVPVWLIILSDQLPIVALVSYYLTNKLIGRRPLPKRLAALMLLIKARIYHFSIHNLHLFISFHFSLPEMANDQCEINVK